MMECGSQPQGPVTLQIMPSRPRTSEIILPEEVLPPNEFVIKVEESCNYGCKRCYMYEDLGSGAENGRDRRVYNAISDETLRRTGFLINEHAKAFGLSSVKVNLHGGEPLQNIAKAKRNIEILLEEIKDTKVLIDITSNGTNVSEEFVSWCESLATADRSVTIGLSIDGLPDDHNDARPTIGGQPTYERVARAANILKQHPSVFDSILCTVHNRNLQSDPGETYRSLRQFIPDRLPAGATSFYMNFLLLHGSHDSGHPYAESQTADNPHPEVAWLVGDEQKGTGGMLTEWLSDPKLPRVRIPLFAAIINDLDSLHLAKGEQPLRSGGGFTGDHPIRFVTIGVNGEISTIDTFRALTTGYHGDVIPNANVNDPRFTFAGVMKHAEYAMLQAGPPEACLANCPLGDRMPVCGGGMPPHRMSTAPRGAVDSLGNKLRPGINNPTIYCETNQLLIQGVVRAMERITGNPA